jgi:hypothetical protein
VQHVRDPVAHALELDEVRRRDLVEPPEPLHLHDEQDRLGERLEASLLEPARKRLQQFGRGVCESGTGLGEVAETSEQQPQVAQRRPHDLQPTVPARLRGLQHVHVATTAPVVHEHVLVTHRRHAERLGDVHHIAVAGQHFVRGHVELPVLVVEREALAPDTIGLLEHSHMLVSVLLEEPGRAQAGRARADDGNPWLRAFSAHDVPRPAKCACTRWCAYSAMVSTSSNASRPPQ